MCLSTEDVPHACISQAAEIKIKASGMPHHTCKVSYATENFTTSSFIVSIVQRLEINTVSTLLRSRKPGDSLKVKLTFSCEGFLPAVLPVTPGTKSLRHPSPYLGTNVA